MKIKFYHLLLAAVLSISASLAFAADEPKLESIFNGKDLSGWKFKEYKGKRSMSKRTGVEDGILISENDEKMIGSMIETEKNYKDFVIEFDARWSGEVDSGVFVRKKGLQMQIGVSRSLKKDMTTSFYTGSKEKYPESGQGKDVEKLIKPGDWNHFRIEVKGNHFTTYLNGKKSSDYVSDNYAEEGPIALQIHPGLLMRVDFRDIKVGSYPAQAESPQK